MRADKTPSFKQLLANPVQMLAFGFGSGLSKKAPGTMGTLVAIPFYYVLIKFFENGYAAALILVVVSGVWICGKAADDIGVHDHGGIVWDEIAGYLLTMYWVAFSWQNVILGFVLFRLFDIAKPWPINWLDTKVKGGLGIMVDDLLAGLMSAGCLYVLTGLL
ncbi:MAG: phosphatidylglycerophosphatase A [Cycloclasticus pugetii]|uniref:Phosphatidylglycerophosphatase A n=2 Tax=Cycloclasticus TaxID=34067 RepID=S5TEC9_9GAMM|nr:MULTISPECIES: phosphatidylglycerophosphatase A [Cycloclasticus]AFT67616.1 Phosphatidylglycerophosphatase A [Cycloclasticus sp. P1]AGS39212.1 Phosphatidylglycerophosphatase A [Cycloclasticus zancles 78-ME]ATI02839.1 phosphatidylglycerophosphatase A [Cycloclasticus sp. PY97N]EPD13584.1 phosphatidylglycerophosphatase A [Cycloclasticus pugetii]PHR48620.1 MAG: phosphatidylglycerophosphatase A [Cycloclasticus sp.]